MPNVVKSHENWGSIEDLSVRLSDQIETHCNETDERFDRLVVLPRGGFAPANIVSRRLGFEAPEILSASITSYNFNETERNNEFRYGQLPCPEEIAGRGILVIDEVCDTGYTLQHLTDLLQLAGAGLVRSGVLHFKPESSRKNSGFIPDFKVVHTEDWIEYPWENSEVIGVKSKVKNRALISVF